MKLFSFFAVSCGTVLADDRAYANRPAFIMNSPENWGPKWKNSQFEDIKAATDEYFAKYITDETPKRGKAVADKMKGFLAKTQNMMTQFDENCRKDGRKRRSADDTRGFTLATTSHQDAFKSLFKQYARWIRNTFQEDCPKESLRLLKRVDRLQVIWNHQVCRESTGIETERDCTWFRQFDHPRKRDGGKYLDNAYGRETNQQFTVQGCQGNPAKLVCPYGGKIEITSSSYGRQTTWECAQNAVGKVKKCAGKDTTADTKTDCNGKESCTFKSQDVEDVCKKFDSYEQVNYVCV